MRSEEYLLVHGLGFEDIDEFVDVAWLEIDFFRLLHECLLRDLADVGECEIEVAINQFLVGWCRLQ